MRQFSIDSDILAGANEQPLKWWQGEDLKFSGTVMRGSRLGTIPVGATCEMQVWVEGTPETLYVDKAGTVSVTTRQWELSLDPDESRLSVGSYIGVIRILDSGGDPLITVWSGPATVKEMPSDGASPVGGTSPAVLKSLFGANQILAADTANTPTGRTIGEAEIVGRQTGGAIGSIARVSAGEITAGSQTAMRAFSPKDIYDMIIAHGGGGGGAGYIHPVVFVPEDFNFDVSEASGAIGWKPASIDQAWAQGGGAGLQTSGSSQTGWLRCNKPLPAWADWRASRAFVLHFWATNTSSALALEVWGYDSDTISKASQVHDGSNGATTLSDSTKAWAVNSLATRGVRNLTKGTSDVITTNTETTFNTLGGMTFDNGDLYVLMPVAVLSETGIVAAVANTFQEVAYDKADLLDTTMWQYLAVNIRFSSTNNYPVLKFLEVWGA